jgi:hypothetical protein
MMTNDSRIRGKVAAILSKRELVLNVGTEHGVEVGMRFVILNRKGVDVKDPDSGEVIGTVEVPKTVIKVVRVDGARISVGRTFRTIEGTPGLAASIVSMTGRPARTETLDIEAGTSIKAELADVDSLVKPGDVALQTEGDEYDDL